MSGRHLEQLRRTANTTDGWTDVFGNQVAQRTNVLDLASHYPYSPERWRVYVDGTRQFPMYGTVTQYNHDVDRHALQPAAGETVILQSAERPRYVVQYELAATFAFAVSQSLAPGDRIRVGLYDGTDGWYFEHTGDHGDAEGDFVMERAGSVVYREADQNIIAPVTQFARLGLATGWYDITRQRWDRSFATTEDGTAEQENPTVATAAAPDVRGPRTGNLPIRFEVTAGASTTDLTLLAGSAAQVNLGETAQFNRSKKVFATDTLSVTGAWEPLRAFRVDPDRDIVTVQLSNVQAGKFSAQDDAEIVLLAGDPSKVLDGGGAELGDGDFAYPPETNAQNSVIQEATAVDQFPDETGTPQTSMVNPGGWQLARSELLADSGRALASTGDIPVKAKRPLYSQDVAVVLGKSDTTGDISYQLQFEQDW